MMIPDVLQGLYARRDALEQKLGEAIVTMSRVASASADAQDDETAGVIESIAFRLQSVKNQIAAYEGKTKIARHSHRVDRQQDAIRALNA